MQMFKKEKESGKGDWSTSGTFMNRPTRGWLHPDADLAVNRGVCYTVRYVGCLMVKVSMKSLEFDTRTLVAKESIRRVCDHAGVTTVSKKRKLDKRVRHLVADTPNTKHAGSNVTLTITTDSLHLYIMETGEVIANHLMAGISFASGGDTETVDFVAYVAKDIENGRACHVLECVGGMAQDVITTIGQAFELRYKEFLMNQPKAVQIPEPIQNFYTDESRWGEENEYYNDRPDAMPPSPPPPIPPLPKSRPQVNNDHQLKNDIDSILFGHESPVYDNSNADLMPDVSRSLSVTAQPTFTPNNNTTLDPFDMEPFTINLPPGQSPPPAQNGVGKNSLEPTYEDWYHGPMSRKQAEGLLTRNGDFLVRESTNTPGQYVLSGMQNGKIKHLLLVDPDGQVRTKDRLFDNVSHLISFHRDKNIPIVSQDSELVLQNPINASPC